MTSNAIKASSARAEALPPISDPTGRTVEPPPLRRRYSLFLSVVAGLLFIWVCLPDTSEAQIKPITPSGLNTLVSDPIPLPSGATQYNITGGFRPNGGTNLFHSFGEFGVPTSNIANFFNETGLLTSNILGRVTGTNGNPSISTILGAIQTEGFGNANLYLMNPAGFLFGPNATLNVGGMVAFTTADSLRLTDGVQFNAILNAAADALLTAAPVAAFGFLGPNAGAITVHGMDVQGAMPTDPVTGEPVAQRIAFVGGDVSLVPDPESGVPNTLTAPGRQIQLTSVAGAGEVAADTAAPAPGMALGTVTLGQDTVLSTAGDPLFGDGSGGAVAIQGGQFVATGALILTGPALGSTGQGGAVTIASMDTASLTNATIDASSFLAGGNGGAISITASRVSLQDSFLLAEAIGDGTTAGGGGAVRLTGTTSVALTRSSILTDSSASNGDGGAVTITAPIVSLQDSRILTGALGDGITTTTGSGGAVTLAGATSVSLTGLASAIDTSVFDSQGNAGRVDIVAPTITLQGGLIDTSTHNTTQDPNAGHAADIAIQANQLAVTSVTLESSVDGPGTFSRGGAIRVNVAEDLLLDSGAVFRTTTLSQTNAGNIELEAKNVTLTGNSALFSDTLGQGSGGTIKITGGESIALESGSRISTTSAFAVADQGPAGRIELNTQQLTITGGSRVESETAGSGLGGIITVQGRSSPAESVLIDGASSGIFTNAQGTGAGGDTNIAAQSVTIQNGGAVSASTSGNAPSATGGDITIRSDRSVTMKSGASISASSTGPANAGNIFINAGQNYTSTNSSVTTQASQASGGKIEIKASDMVRLTNSQINTSVADGTGGGGNITIDPNFVILQNSQILAQAFAGQGGNITITTGTFLPDANSLVDASSQFGLSGTVTIQSPTSNLSAVWARLQQNYVEAAALLRGRCAAQVSGAQSSFVLTGRDALPLEPGGWLTSPLAALGADARREAQGARGQEEGEGAQSVVASSVLAFEGGILSLWGFDQNLSWPGLGQTPRRFASVLDTACGS